jgi:uncharacterized protein (DUF58 family)
MSQGEGLRRSSSKGRSAEFSGYREYVLGDDMRYLDWNAYARFDKMYIKEFMEEKEGRVNIYIDTSKSMDFGERLKSTLLSELTEAISYIASTGRDSVYVTDLSTPTSTFKVPGGGRGVGILKHYLEGIQPSGSVNLKDSLKRAVRGRGGVAFIISDFMDEGFLDSEEDILKLYGYHGMKVTLIQVLSREELEVEEDGAFQLIDSENEDSNVRLTLDRYSIRDYKRSLDAYMRNISEKAKKVGADYVLCSTKDSVSKLLFEKLQFLFE